MMLRTVAYFFVLVVSASPVRLCAPGPRDVRVEVRQFAGWGPDSVRASDTTIALSDHATMVPNYCWLTNRVYAMLF